MKNPTTPPMTAPYVDTNVLIRLLTGNDMRKQHAAQAFFERVERGNLTVAAPDTVIADAVYVLASPRLYALSRVQVSALLAPLVSLPHFHVKNRRAVLRALALYAATNLDFGDVFIVAAMEQARVRVVYSYDAGFDRLPAPVHIIRQEP